MNEKVEIQDLYCKWCPQDCKGLTRKEQLGCVASDGFAEELRELGYHKLPTPDSKEYQELQGVVCKQLNCYDKDCEYHGFPRCPYCVEIIDKVLALLGGKE